MLLTTYNNPLEKVFAHAFDSLFSPEENNSVLETSYKGVTLYENGDNLMLSVDLPGIKKEEISLELKENVLHIQAKRKIEIDEEAKVYSRGQPEYQIHQQVRLPFGVNEKKLQAKYENGVVTLTLPKKEEEKAKLIPLQ